MMQKLYSPSLVTARGVGSEIKFLIDRPLADRITDWARMNLEPDPYGTGPAKDRYEIETIYLDTPSFDVLKQNGSYGRAKYRIRRYGDSSSLFVERKMKAGGKVRKRRSKVLASDDQPLWFQRRVRARQLAPVCRISYARTARMGATERGPIRLTLDDSIVAALPDGSAARALYTDQVILELKYVQPLPACFTDLIVQFGLQTGPASKYRAAGAALELGVAAYA